MDDAQQEHSPTNESHQYKQQEDVPVSNKCSARKQLVLTRKAQTLRSPEGRDVAAIWLPNNVGIIIPNNAVIVHNCVHNVWSVYNSSGSDPCVESNQADSFGQAVTAGSLDVMCSHRPQFALGFHTPH